MKKKNTVNRIARRVASLAAALLLLVIGLAGAQTYRANHSVYSTVSLDVNPSVEILVNQKDVVLEVRALNEDGKTIIGDMDFKNSDLDVALNALIGSMLRNGYLSDIANSILVSVESGDPAHSAQLQERLIQQVSDMLSTNAFGGAVLCQTVESSENLQTLASTHNVSLGKAQLVSQIADQNALYSFEELVPLSINELNLLSASNNVTTLATNGSASDKAYIGQDAALAKALAHAGLAADEVMVEKNLMDYEHGVMVYEIEFTGGEFDYEYDINALTGEVVKSERDYNDDYIAPAQDLPAADENLIGVDAAKSAALDHAGLSAGDISNYVCTLDREDGRIVYEIDFYVGFYDYDYKIDAQTGAVLKDERDLDEDAQRAAQAADATAQSVPQIEQPAVQNNSGVPQTEQPAAQNNSGAAQTGGEYLDKTAVRDIVLAHANVSAADVTRYSYDLDRDDGVVHYDVEFDANGYEFDYDVDAVSGAVISFSRERDGNAPMAQTSQPTPQPVQEAPKAEQQSASSGYIGESAAKSKALGHAGVSSSDARGLKCELDRDDGRVVYEIEFKAGGYEYDYEIDASSGSVLKSEKDRDD